jgi:Flp pilus assembly protein TadB
MLYETVWMICISTVCILLSIGLLSLILSLSMAVRGARAAAMALSVVIVITGLYVSYRWNAEKREIQALGLKAEQALDLYMTTPKK